jgi:pimeloyl-ACP methyl ester carboxylesterase
MGVILLSTHQSIAGVPLVFIPGIKGSSLVDEQKKVQWLDIFEAMALRTPNIKLPLTWDQNNHQGADSLVATEPLKQIDFFFNLFQYPIYKNWLKGAEDLGHPFLSFAYDWRRDNEETLDKLTLFITKVFEENGKRKINIVGHSMGGMLTFAFAGIHPEMIQNLFIAGSPLQGGIGFLPDLTEGTATALNKKITSAEVLSTFPSVYSFFPFDSENHVLSSQGLPIKVDFFSTSTWESHWWGLFNSENIDLVASRNFLTKALDQAKLFRKKLSKQSMTYPKIFIISSRAHKTLKAVTLNETHLKLDFKSQPQGDGDGRVCETDALPPTGIPYELFETSEPHEHLLEDPKVQQFIKAKIQ